MRHRQNAHWPRPSVCLSLAVFPHHCMDPGVTRGDGRRCPLVVHCWADLQSVHALRCYDNIHARKLIPLYAANTYSAKCEMSATACHSLYRWFRLFEIPIHCRRFNSRRPTRRNSIYFCPVVSFFFLFFPRLISAVGDWMSTILPHMVCPYCEFKMQV